MRFDANYQIEKAVDSGSGYATRPQLTHIHVRRLDGNRGIAEAADGYLYVQVPVEFDTADNVPGLLSVAALKAARKAMPRAYQGTVELLLEQDWVVILDGSRLPRRAADVDGTMTFPDVSGHIPTQRHESGQSSVKVEAKQLLRIQQALGAPYLRLSPQGSTAPILVEPGGRPLDADPSRPPVALVMPHGRP